MKWWTPRMARGLRRSFLPTVVENFSVCRRREGGKSSVNCPNCWIGVCLHSASIRFPLFRMWNYRIVVGSLVRQKRRTPPETWRAYFLLNIKFSEAAWWCSPSTCITCVALNLSGAGRRRWCLPYLYQTSTRTHSGWLLFVYVFWRHKASRMQREIKTKKPLDIILCYISIVGAHIAAFTKFSTCRNDIFINHTRSLQNHRHEKWMSRIRLPNAPHTSCAGAFCFPHSYYYFIGGPRTTCALECIYSQEILFFGARYEVGLGLRVENYICAENNRANTPRISDDMVEPAETSCTRPCVCDTLSQTCEN